ncbi:unnamed protein product [Arabidopsis arenosa]|uniref:Uncharacterized protein n=1 Tax=Arabidopsis arenosa TaxID=38785 RepID=A0A8S1ZNZ8_ARAAE|nr:unnamed protein product [Arabidopsis arenosa]
MAAQVEIEDQESVTTLDNGEIINPVFSGDTTILLRESTFEHDLIKNCFLSGMESFANETTIVTVRKNSTERRITTKAKFAVFKIFTEAMTRKNNGDANVKYGWYSGSKEEIDRVITYGFSNREIKKFENDVGSHGVGIHLVHHRYSLAAALVGEGDEEGIKNILLCRVILGLIGRARSPCVSFSVLMSILSKSLDVTRMNLILTTYDDFRKRKLRREQLVRKIREVVGDHLLFKILKNQRR